MEESQHTCTQIGVHTHQEQKLHREKCYEVTQNNVLDKKSLKVFLKEYGSEYFQK